MRAGDALADVEQATSVRVRDGERIVTDGPFAETKETLGGYYLIDVEHLDDAIEAARRCPGARYGTIEVRPLVDDADGDARVELRRRMRSSSGCSGASRGGRSRP